MRSHCPYEWTALLESADRGGIWETPMPPYDHSIKNRLLTVMDDSDFQLLLPSLKEVPLALSQVLEAPGRPISHVYFIQSGLVSVLAISGRNRRIEFGMVGAEGMTGFAVILDDDRSANQMVVQRAGSALRMSAAELKYAMLSSISLRSCLLRFVHVFIAQASQTALANGCAKLEERLARWILMSHDRSGGADVGVTHDVLAVCLGVRRPGVTLAMHLLEGTGVIKSTRSRISVVDRDGLHKHANASYGVAERTYDRNFPNSVGT
jgi:CRP-like cAMP-binding protein